MSARVSADIRIRPATEEDLVSLVRLEERCFDTDRMSKRSFRAQIHSDHNLLLVAELEGRVMGYILIFMRLGVSLARLYSVAVDPDSHGLGIGNRLMDAAEQQAAASTRITTRITHRPCGSRNALFIMVMAVNIWKSPITCRPRISPVARQH